MTSTLPHPAKPAAPSFATMLAELREMLATDKPGTWEARSIKTGYAASYVARIGNFLFGSFDDFDDVDAELELAAACRNALPAVIFSLDLRTSVLGDIALALNDWYAERKAAHEVKAKAWREMQDKQPPGNIRWTYAAEMIRRDDEENLEPIRKLMRRADAVLPPD